MELPDKNKKVDFEIGDRIIVLQPHWGVSRGTYVISTASTEEFGGSMVRVLKPDGGVPIPYDDTYTFPPMGPWVNLDQEKTRIDVFYRAVRKALQDEKS